jgi:hypothetical protein
LKPTKKVEKGVDKTPFICYNKIIQKKEVTTMNTIPTDGEITAYIVLGIIALLAFWFLMRGADTRPEIEITWGQRRDWERRQREYERRTR